MTLKKYIIHHPSTSLLWETLHNLVAVSVDDICKTTGIEHLASVAQNYHSMSNSAWSWLTENKSGWTVPVFRGNSVGSFLRMSNSRKLSWEKTSLIDWKKTFVEKTCVEVPQKRSHPQISQNSHKTSKFSPLKVSHYMVTFSQIDAKMQNSWQLSSTKDTCYLVQIC